MMPAPVDVERTAKALRINARLHVDIGEASTAQEAARALEVPLEAIGKSIVLMIREDAPVLVVVPGDRRASEAKVAEEVEADAEDVRMADPDEVEEHTGFPVGAVPPIGLERPIRTLVDERLLDRDKIYAGAGSDDAMLEVTSSDLSKLPDVSTGDFSEPA